MNSKINNEGDNSLLETINNLKNTLTTRTTRSRTQVSNFTQKGYCASHTEMEQNGRKRNQTDTGLQNRGEAKSKPIHHTSKIQSVEYSRLYKEKIVKTDMLRTKKTTTQSQPISVIHVDAHHYHLTLFSLLNFFFRY